MELQIAKNDGLYKVLTLKFNEPLFFFLLSSEWYEGVLKC